MKQARQLTRSGGGTDVIERDVMGRVARLGNRSLHGESLKLRIQHEMFSLKG